MSCVTEALLRFCASHKLGGSRASVVGRRLGQIDASVGNSDLRRPVPSWSIHRKRIKDAFYTQIEEVSENIQYAALFSLVPLLSGLIT